MRQQTVNGRMRPVKSTPNPMQRLSRFPAAPHLRPLRHGKLHVFPLRHRHHLGRKIYIRWCCIDLLNAPALPDKWLPVVAFSEGSRVRGLEGLYAFPKRGLIQFFLREKWKTMRVSLPFSRHVQVSVM